jgi:hypothetical protein
MLFVVRLGIKLYFSHLDRKASCLFLKYLHNPWKALVTFTSFNVRIQFLNRKIMFISHFCHWERKKINDCYWIYPLLFTRSLELIILFYATKYWMANGTWELYDIIIATMNPLLLLVIFWKLFRWRGFYRDFCFFFTISKDFSIFTL